MVGDVLTALRDCEAIEQTIVVTNESAVAAAAHYQGAIVLADTAEDWPERCRPARDPAGDRGGIRRVLCIPATAPRFEPEELVALLADQRQSGGSPMRGRVLIVPDRHGTGTNGLLLEPPDAIEPSSPQTAASATRRSRWRRGPTARSSVPPRCCSTSTRRGPAGTAGAPWVRARPGARTRAVLEAHLDGARRHTGSGPMAGLDASSLNGLPEVLSGRRSCAAHSERACGWATTTGAQRRRDRGDRPEGRLQGRGRAARAGRRRAGGARARGWLSSRTGTRAFIQVVLDQSQEILRAERGVIVSRTSTASSAPTPESMPQTQRIPKI